MRHPTLRIARSTLLAGVLWALIGLTPAAAQACSYTIRNSFIDTFEINETMRCLIRAIDNLRRDNARLQRRIAALERLVGDLPATWSNENGKITEDPGRPIGSASLLLSARSTGGASELAVEQRVLEEVCGASGGCTLTIALKQLSLFDNSPKNSAISGPCQFTYVPRTGAWAVGKGCGAGAVSGIDGDGGVAAGEGNSAEIAIAGGACVFTDAGLARAVGNEAGLASDRSKGLFLIAMPSRQTDGIRRFQCELALK